MPLTIDDKPAPPGISAPDPRAVANWFRLALVVLIVTASVRVVLTYSVFSLTADEPAHVICGLEWLEKGKYTIEVQHPPLARVMTALLPFLAGARLPRKKDIALIDGCAILNSGGNSGDRNLTLARLGILPFLWLGIWVLYRTTEHYFGCETALLAAGFFSFLPPILAHAGLATTDIALTATLGMACLALLFWVERPSISRSAGLGAAVGVTILAKLSSLVFFPAIILAMALTRLVCARPSPRALFHRVRLYLWPAAIALCAAAVCIWAGYRFSFDKYPAPELFAGIQSVRLHNQEGQLSYLLGARSQYGFWYYYPVILSVKTPLALLLLFFAGAWVCWKRRTEFDGRFLQPLAFAGGILAVGFASRINIGVRHILPVYFAICVVAAIGTHAVWRAGRRANRALPLVLLAWMIASTFRAHPDYLAYFNELAGNSPQSIAVDSDLDWAQDWKRVAQRLKAAGATEVAVDPLLVKNPQILHGFPKLTPLDPDGPKPGWNVVSITMLKLRTGMFHDSPREHPWAERIPPTERIGKGLLLWHIPEIQAKER